MGELFTATTKAADAPSVEPGLCDAVFKGVTKKFITGGDYGDGDRYEWSFLLLADDGTPLEYETSDGEVKPLIVNGLTSLSLNTTSKTKPKALRYMSALLSEPEFAAWTQGEATLNTDDLIGRKVQVEIFVKDSGWPGVSNVLPPRKARVGRSGIVEGTSNTAAASLPF